MVRFHFIRNEHKILFVAHVAIGYCEGRGTPITARKSQSECMMLATPALYEKERASISWLSSAPTL